MKSAEINNLQQKIYKLLTEKEHLRDSDERLVCNIWYNQIGKQKIESMSALDLMNIMIEEKIDWIPSIIRARAIIQSKHKHLQGKNYYKRKKAESEVAQNIDRPGFTP